MDEKKRSYVTNNSGEENWYTPQIYIESARKVFGGVIHTDPASTQEANEVVRADVFFTKKENGLLYPWYGNVWLNPPYTNGVIVSFIGKLVDEWRYRNTSQAIVLVNNATETKWFSSLMGISTAIVFPRQRIKFWSVREKSSSPLQGQAFCYVGKAPEVFISEFSQYGLAFKPVR